MGRKRGATAEELLRDLEFYTCDLAKEENEPIGPPDGWPLPPDQRYRPNASIPCHRCGGDRRGNTVCWACLEEMRQRAAVGLPLTEPIPESRCERRTKRHSDAA